MAKRQFTENLSMSNKNYEKLLLINNIINEYLEDGYKLTLRQLYYQLVSRGVIPNEDREYAKLSRLLKEGRMAGIVDWEAIEDRLRVPKLPYWVFDIPDAMDDTIKQYRLDRMKGQDVYIEIAVEKDALSNVLWRVTSYYHIKLMVNRGYSSCTTMYDTFNRMKRAHMDGKTPIILYLGDHDPSGLDMIRDIKDRLAEFGIVPEVEQIALTGEQIRKYQPPPNPAKVKDPRAKWYIERYGRTSWEVDALNPKILHQLLIDKIEALIDVDLFKSMIAQEESDKSTLREIKDDLMERSKMPDVLDVDFKKEIENVLEDKSGDFDEEELNNAYAVLDENEGKKLSSLDAKLIKRLLDDDDQELIKKIDAITETEESDNSFD